MNIIYKKGRIIRSFIHFNSDLVTEPLLLLNLLFYNRALIPTAEEFGS